MHLLRPIAAVLAAACATVAQADPAPTLHLRFTLEPGLGWTALRLAPQQADWRRADGSPATPSQVRAVLATLASVEVAARCAGWVDGATLYPCGFAVEAERADHAPFAAQAIHWSATAAARERSIREAPAGVREAGLIAPVLDEAQRVAVVLPSAAVGARLSIRIRPLSNHLVPSQFDRASGELVLRGGKPAAGSPA